MPCFPSAPTMLMAAESGSTFVSVVARLLSMPRFAFEGSACARAFAAACKPALAKLASRAVGKMDLARLSPWLSAFSATGAPTAAQTLRCGRMPLI